MTKRNPWLVLLFSLITLGIYTLYWLYVTRKEMVAVLQDKKAVWPVIILFAPYLAILGAAILYGVSSFVFTSVESDQFFAQQPTALNIVLFLVGGISTVLAIVLPFIWFYKFCRAIYTVSRHTETGLLFGLWIALNIFAVGAIWYVIAQNDLNKAGAPAPADPGTPPVTPQPPSQPFPPATPLA